MNKLQLIYIVQIVMMCNALAMGWSVICRGDNTLEFCKAVDPVSSTALELVDSCDYIVPVMHQLLYPLSPYWTSLLDSWPIGWFVW